MGCKTGPTITHDAATTKPIERIMTLLAAVELMCGDVSNRGFKNR